MRPAALLMMGVIADLAEQAVRIGIETAPRLANVGAAGNDVEEVRNDAGCQKRLAMGVEVEPPGITGAFGKNTELARVRAIAPDGGVHLHAADPGPGEDAVQAVEQAVRSPLQGVQHLVGVMAAEAVQENVDLVAVAAPLGVLKKEEVGSGAEKNAAMTHLDAAGHVEMRQVLPLDPDGDLVGLAGAGRVLPHLEAVARLSAA